MFEFYMRGNVMKILIVEDEITSRTVLTKILVNYGSCDYAVDGLETIEYFKEALEKNDSYDLVCLDIVMPNMDGKAALRELRQIEKDKGISRSDGVKIIMTTSIDDPKTVVQTFNEGASAYLVKPIQGEELLEEIRGFGLISA